MKETKFSKALCLLALITALLLMALIPLNAQAETNPYAWTMPTYTTDTDDDTGEVYVDSVTVNGKTYPAGDWYVESLNENFEAIIVSFGKNIRNASNALIVRRKATATDPTATFVLPDDYAIQDDTGEDEFNFVYLFLGEGVTGVGARTFDNETLLQAVYATPDFKTIGESAFEGCAKLETIPLAKVNTIGKNAFKDCPLLVAGNIGTDLTSGTLSIGEGAFQNDSALGDVTIGGGNTGSNTLTIQIGKNAFADTTIGNLKIAVGNGNYNTTIAGYSGTVGDTVVYDGAFNDATIGKVYIAMGNGNNSTTIGGYAFRMAEINNTLAIGSNSGNSTYTIGGAAFYQVTKLTTVTLGGGENNTTRSSIGGSAFEQIDSITQLTLGNNLNIGNYAFYHDNGLTKVTFGNNVTSGEYAFYYDTNLVYATFGTNNVIGGHAFRCCYKLKGSYNGSTPLNYLDLSNVTSIGSAAFECCYSALTEVKFSANLTTLGSYAFIDCNALTTLTDFDKTSITVIPTGAFECTRISTVTIPAGVTKIESFAFSAFLSTGTYRRSGSVSGQSVYNNTKNDTTGTTSSAYAYSFLTTVDFSQCTNLTSIGSYAFYRQGLDFAELTLPASCKTIGDYAFYYLSAGSGRVEKITFASEDTLSIGYMAFYSANVKEITIKAKDTLTLGGYAFYSNAVNALTIDTTDKVTFGDSAFRNHKGTLNKLVINANDITIGANCFFVDSVTNTNYQTLTEVLLGGTKINIGQSAFENNINLSLLRMPNMVDGSKLTLGKLAFGNTNSNAYADKQIMTLGLGTYSYYLKDGSSTVGMKKAEYDALTKAQQDLYEYREDTENVQIDTGMTIITGWKEGDSATNPFNKFIAEGINANYYSGVKSVSLTLISKVYPTCTQEGSNRYRMEVGDKTYYYNLTVEALGHMYGSLSYKDANCSTGEYYERCCIRGHIDPEWGVNTEGYAINSFGNKIDTVANPCREAGYSKSAETGTGEKLNHEYYAGRLYKKYMTLTSAEYASLTANEKTNFFIRYQLNGTSTLINRAEYQELSADEQANYTICYIGNKFYTDSEYNALTDKTGLVTVNVGSVIGNFNISDSSATDYYTKTSVKVGGVTYDSPFNNFSPVYISYACYRDYGASSCPTDNNSFSIAYIPTNLAGYTSQTLSEIDLGVKNLSWANPTQSLKGAQGLRPFTALYTPTGNGVDYYKPIEITVYINVTREVISFEDVSFINTRQSTTTDKGSHNNVLVNGLSNFAIRMDTKFFDSTHTEKTWAEIGAIHTDFTGTVEIAFQFSLDVCDLLADTDVFYLDGVYHNDSTKNITTLNNLASGYTFVSMSVTNDGYDNVLTVVISHAFTLETPKLSIVESRADNVIYNGAAHGFTLYNVPASSTITVTRWSALEDGVLVIGTDAYTQGITVSDPTGTLDVYSDLRTIEDFEAITQCQNAGTYYYKVEITNSGYQTYGGTSYSEIVTVVIGKATIAVPVSKNFTFTGLEQKGFEETQDYTVSYAQSEFVMAGTYEATLTLKDAANYKWNGYAENVSSVNVTWVINKYIVAIPAFDETKRTITYNGTYQTPLLLSNVNTCEDLNNPKNGEYKTVQNSTTKTQLDVYIYLGNQWRLIYFVGGAYGLNANDYIVYSNVLGLAVGGGLLDTNNFLWPNNAETLALGGWTMEKAEIELPTLDIPDKEYDGNVYELIHSSTRKADQDFYLNGSWDAVNAEGVSAFNHDFTLSFVYYNAIGAPLTGAPSEVGSYTVAVVVKSALADNNYTISGTGTVTGSFTITKGKVTLISSIHYSDDNGETFITQAQYDALPTETNAQKIAKAKYLLYYTKDSRDYNGESQTLPLPTVLLRDVEYTLVYDLTEKAYYLKDSDDKLTKLDSSFKLRYYLLSSANEQKIDVLDPTADDGVTVLKDGSGKTISQINYVLVTTDVGAVISTMDGKVGSYIYWVEIDTSCDSYESINNAIVSLEINKGNQTITVETVGNTLMELSPYNQSQKTYTLTGAIGHEPVTLFVRGEFDLASILVFNDTYTTSSSGNISLAGGNVTVKVDYVVNIKTGAYEGANITIALTGQTTGTNLSISTVGTDNASPATITLSIVAGKATPTVNISKTDKYTSGSSYRGEALYNFSSSLTGKKIISITNAQTDLPFVSEACTLKFIVNYDSKKAIENQTFTSTQPTTVGDYYAVYYYAGDANYLSAYSDPLQFSITNATLNVTATPYSGTYDGQAHTPGTFVVKAYDNATAITGYTVVFHKGSATGTVVSNLTNVSESGTYYYVISYANYSDKVGSFTVSISRLNITVTSTGHATSKVYDATDAVITSAKATSWNATWTTSQDVAGKINSITVSGKYAGGANIVSNGNLTLTYTVNGKTGFIADNYTLNTKTLTSSGTYSDSTTYKGSITAKSITITGISATDREYNGTKKMYITAPSGLTINGLVTADVGKVTASLVNKAYGTTSSAGLTSSQRATGYANFDVTVASNQISLSGTNAGNYTISGVYATGTTPAQGKIYQRVLDFTFGEQTFTYTGAIVTGYKTATVALHAADADDTADVATYVADINSKYITYEFYSDLACNNKLSSTPSAAGTYYIKVSIDRNNCKATPVVKKLVISSADLTVSFNTYSAVYDGTSHTFKSLIKSVVGAANNKTPSYTATFYASAADRTNKQNAITSFKNVSQSGTYYVNISATNYNDVNDTVSVTITKASLTISDNLVITKTYDGTNALSNIGTATATVTGMKNSEVITATIASASYASIHASTSNKVTVTYTYNFGTALSGNYDYSTSKEYTGTINKLSVTVTGVNSTTKTYDGFANNIVLTDGSITNTVFQTDLNNAKVELSQNTSVKGTASSKDIGTRTVTVGTNAYSITGDYKDDYTISSVVCGDVTINAATPVFTWPINMSPTYTGNNIADTYYKVTVSGVSETPAGAVSYTFSTDGTNYVSTLPKDVATYTVKADITANGNYCAYSETETLTVVKAQFVQVNMTGYVNRVYNGQAETPATFTVRGTTTDGTLTLNADSLGYTVKFYSDSAKQTEVTTVKNVADSMKLYYTISSPNYEDFESDVTISITRYNAGIDATINKTKTYDQSTASNTVSVATALLASDELTITAVGNYNSASAGQNKTITITYSISAKDGKLLDNFYFSNASTALQATETKVYCTDAVISPLGITVTGATATNRLYNGEKSVVMAGTLSPVGVLAGDTVSASYASAVGTISSADVGTYDVTVALANVTLSGAEAGNYAITGIYATGTTLASVTISKATPYGYWIGSLKAGYSEKTVENSYYYAGFKGVGTESETVLASQTDTNITYTFHSDSACTSTAISAPTERGTYYVKATFGETSNYNSTAITGTLIITETGIYSGGSSITLNNHTYNGLAQSIISGANVLSDLYVDDTTTHRNINESSYAKIYLAKVLSTDTERPASDSSRWALAWGYENKSGTATLMTEGLATEKDAGTYTYWIMMKAEGHADCFSFGGANTSQITLTINKATVTVSSDITTTKVYDGKTSAAVTASAITGIQNSENITLVTTAKYNSKKVGDEKTITISYVLTFANGALASNYIVVEDAGRTLTVATVDNVTTATVTETNEAVISKKEITVIGATATNREYNNTKIVALGGTLTSEGICTDDSSTADNLTFAYKEGATGAISDVHPNTYTVTILATDIVLGGTDAGNYTVTAVTSPQVVISRAKVTAPTADSTTFTYNGTEQTYTLTTSELYSITNNKRTGAGTQSVSVDLNNKTDYMWSDSTDTARAYTFTINKAQSTITFNNGTSKQVTYTGKDLVASTYAVTISGVTGYAPARGDNDANISYEFKDSTSTVVTAIKYVDTYTVTCSYAGDDNYLESSASMTVEITKATLQKSAETTETFSYDGTAHSLYDMLDLIVTGVGDDGTLSLGTGNGKYAIAFYKTEADRTNETNAVTTAKNVADSTTYYYTVKADNYNSVNGSITVTVNKVALTVSATDIASTKVYDGNNKVPNTSGAFSWSVNVSGSINSEVTTATLTAIYTAGKNVCTNGGVTVTYALNGTSDFLYNNYTVNGNALTSDSYEDSTTYTASITKRAVTITGVTTVDRQYDGTTLIKLGGTLVVTNVVDGETVTASYKNDAVRGTSANIFGTSNVTVAVADVVLSDPDNYEITEGAIYASGTTLATVEISKRVLCLSQLNHSVVYSGYAPEASQYSNDTTLMVVDSTYNTDDNSVESQIANILANNVVYTFYTDAACTIPATEVMNVGMYYIKATLPTVDYYTADPDDGSYEIYKAQLIVTPAPYADHFYDKLPHSPATFVVQGVGSDGELVLGTGYTVVFKNASSQVVTDVTNVAENGTYSYVITASNGNYDDATGSVDVNILRKVMTAPTADPTYFYYTGEEQTYTLDTDVDWTISGNVKTHSDVYTVSVALNDKDNFTWSATETDVADKTYSFIIAPATITIENTFAGSKVFDDNTDALGLFSNIYISGIADADNGNITIQLNSAVFNDKHVANANSVLTNYTVSFGSSLASDYTYSVVGKSGSATVDGNTWTVNESQFATLIPSALTVEIANHSIIYNNVEPWTNNQYIGTSDDYWTITEGTLCGSDGEADLGITLTKETGKNVGTYKITGAWTDADYAITFVGEDSTNKYATYEITVRSINIVIGNTSDVFGEFPVLPATLLSLAENQPANGGLAQEETIATIRALNIVLATDATIASPVGKYDIYAAAGNTETVGNYFITYTKGEYSVNYADLVVTIDGQLGNFTYDAISHSVCNKVLVEGIFKGADTWAIGWMVNGVATGMDTPVIRDVLVNSDGEAIAYVIEYSIIAPNYNNYEGSFEVLVSKAELSVNPTYNTSKVYDGLTDAEGNFTKYALSGVQGKDAVSIVANSFVYDNAHVANASKITSNYTVTFADQTLANNYTYKAGTNAKNTSCVANGTAWTIGEDYDATVTPCPLSITIQNQEMLYDNIEPWKNNTSTNVNFWDVTTGAIPSTDEKATLSITLTKAEGIVVGDYAITGACANTDYDITFTNGKYTINYRPIVIAIGTHTVTYGDETPTLPLTLLTVAKDQGENGKGLAKNETIAIIRALSITLTPDLPTFIHAGDYDILSTDGTYGNYDITFVNGTYKVNKRAITLTPDNFSKIYDIAPVSYEGKYQMTAGTLATGDTKTVELYSDIALDSNVGDHDIIVSSVTIMHGEIDVTEDYQITKNVGKYTVEKADFTFEFKFKGMQAGMFGTDFENPVYFRNTNSGRDANLENSNAFNGNIVFSVDNPSLATVNEEGTVHFLNTGTVNVTVTLTDKAGCNYNIPATNVATYTLVIGAAGKITVNVRTLEGYEEIADMALGTNKQQPLIINAVSTYPTNAEVTFYYRLTEDAEWTTTIPSASAIGTYKIYVKATADHYTTYEGSVTAQIFELPYHTITFLFNGGKVDSKSSVSISIKEHLALKQEHFPTPTYTGYTFNNWTNAQDNTVYANNNVEVLGNMTYEANWNKLPFVIDAISANTYNGSKLTPALQVKCGEVTLTEGIDFIATYEENVNVGTAKVSLVGINDYVGFTAETTFEIGKAKITIPTNGTTEFTYNGKEQIYLPEGFDASTMNIELNALTNVGESDAKITLKDTVNYEWADQSTDPIIIHISISAKALVQDDIKAPNDVTFNGEKQEPEAQVFDGEKLLKNGVDYIILYDNVTSSVGTQTITIEGKGNYQGSLNSTFKVNPKNFADEEIYIDAIAVQDYTGSALTPTILVYDGALLLQKGVDYTVEYKNNSKVGTATVIAKGIGNYQGTTTAEFVINGVSKIDNENDTREDKVKGSVENSAGLDPKANLLIDSIKESASLDEITKIVKEAIKNGNLKVDETSVYVEYDQEQLANLLDGMKAKLGMDIAIQVADVSITEFNGIYTVTVSLPDELQGLNSMQIVFVNPDGSVEILETTVRGEKGEKELSFKTTHFSEYYVMGKFAFAFDWWIILIILLVIFIVGLIIGLVIGLLKRRKAQIVEKVVEKIVEVPVTVEVPVEKQAEPEQEEAPPAEEQQQELPPLEDDEEAKTEMSLKESLAIVARMGGSCVGKAEIYKYLDGVYGDKVQLNHRLNTMKKGMLPIPDTHYTKEEVVNGKRVSREKPVCFVYVYETNGNTLLLLRTNARHANYLKRDHARVALSLFPKANNSLWFSLPIDKSYTPEDVFRAIDVAKLINEDPKFIYGSGVKEDPLTLKESLAIAKRFEGSCVNKRDIITYLHKTYGDEVELNNRPNAIHSGLLPLADTHYTKVTYENGEKMDAMKPVCFVYVYETGNSTLLLLKTSVEHAKSIKRRHMNFSKSLFPKSANGSWYSMPIDNTYTPEEVYKALDVAKLANEGHDTPMLPQSGPLTLKESLALAKEQEPCNVKKMDIVNYLNNTYKSEVTTNNRPNAIKSGLLPLADTHYTNMKNVNGKREVAEKPTCFVYVYETGDNVLLLIKTSEAHFKAIKKMHKNVGESKFPKAANGKWYSIPLDSSFTNEEVFGILDAAKAVNECE